MEGDKFNKIKNGHFIRIQQIEFIKGSEFASEDCNFGIFEDLPVILNKNKNASPE